MSTLRTRVGDLQSFSPATKDLGLRASDNPFLQKLFFFFQTGH